MDETRRVTRSRRARIAAAVVAVPLLAAALALGASGELRSAALFQIAPAYASRSHLRRFERADGAAVDLLGTIHNAHLDTPAFSLRHVAAAVEHTHPAILLTEIRPAEIERGNECDGPIEMGLALLRARELGIPAAGIDSWDRAALTGGASSDDAREDAMFERVHAKLRAGETALVLCGFSHVAELARRLETAGFREIEVAAADKGHWLDPPAGAPPYPAGLAACLERRIEVDVSDLETEKDPDWRAKTERNVAVRRKLLDDVRRASSRSPE